MPGNYLAPRVAWVPLAVGTALWTGATLLLVEDAYRLGHVTVQHGLMPVLTASTVAAAVYAERRLRQWRVVGFIGFAILALVGSILTVWSTLGRVSEAGEFHVAVTRNTNDQTAEKKTELKTAKDARDKECKSIGKKCEAWNKRVDELAEQMSGMVTTVEDSKTEATVNFISLVTGANETWLRKLLKALEPVGLPFFLEFGSILFFSAAFPHRITLASQLPPDLYLADKPAPATLETLTAIEATVTQSFSRDEALADFRQLGFSGSQHFLADRWNVHPATVSKWFTVWEAAALISRERAGKNMTATMLALPSPEPRRRRLGHMASLN